MSLWRQLSRGLRSLGNARAADRDVADEVQQYYEDLTAAHEAQGMPPEAARRAARLELGNATVVREQVHDYGWENFIRTWFGDLRYALRQLRKRPGFTMTSVVILALGLGASTAVLSALDPIMFEPLPYPQAKRIVMIWDIYQGERSEVTFHTYREVAARSHSLESVAVFEPWQPTMTGKTQPQRFDGQSVSAGYFSVLGVAPAIGRDFQPGDDRFRGPNLVILSDRLWKQRFNADASIPGRQITLDGQLYTVIGVMPANFDNVLAPSTQLWSPMHYNADSVTSADSSEWGHHLRMIGRTRAGLRLADLRSELNTIASHRVPEFPRMAWASLGNGFLVDSLQADVTRGIKPALLAILGAVVLLLVIASVNVTNLLLARGVQRRGEFAMRIALGASRSRLLRQLLTESLLLAALGGMLGLLVAELGVRGLVALAPVGLPRVDAIAINGTVLLYTFAVTLTVGILVGLAPALHAHRSGLLEDLQQSSHRSAGSHQFTRRTLVVVEVSLALVLLIGAGLLLRSLQRLFAVDPGFRASHLLTMQVQTSGPHFNDNDAARRQFFEQAIEKVRSVPGVKSAAFTSMLPFSQQYDSYGAHFEKTQRGYDVYRYAVTPGYLETMGIALRRGRSLTEDDTATSQPVVLISETLARTAFPDGSDPIGQHVHVGPTNRPWYTVVGVVDDVRQTSLAENRPAGVYLPMEQSWFADEAMALVVRSEQEPSLLAPAVRQAIWSVDKDQPIVRVATAEDLLAASGAERRFAMVLFEIFAVVALILAATGIYGVLSGSVTERVREIGVRAALGASRGNILALLLRQGMALAAIGVAIGLAASLATSRALITLLFGVSQLDPITYGGVVLLLLAVSAAACWIPARRAAQVDPSTALRAE